METIKNVTTIGIYEEEIRFISKDMTKNLPRSKYTLIAEDISRIADRTIGVTKRVSVFFKEPITCYIRGDNIYCGLNPEGRTSSSLL
jgi:hypothetical protein